jgi:hypothetical protein
MRGRFIEKGEKWLAGANMGERIGLKRNPMNKAGSDHANQAFEEYVTLTRCRVRGVDDIDWDRSARNRAVLGVQKGLSAVFGWHFSMAMYRVCTLSKP